MDLQKTKIFDTIQFIPVKPDINKVVHPKQEIPEREESKKGYKAGHVVSVALSAAVLAGAAVHGRNKDLITKLRRTVQKGEAKITELAGKVEGLSTANKDLTEAKKKLQEELDRARKTFETLIDADGPWDETLYVSVKGEIEAGKLDYDILNPPATKISTYESSDVLAIPDVAQTGFRAHITPLDIPEIAADGSFSFMLPRTNEMSVVKLKSSVKFTPVTKQTIGISENYADSVRWDQDKVARDILQNFFDGHGQTLDGVKIDFVPLANGKFRVRISGEGTYSPDKAVLLGESSKQKNSKAAGNYGEGLKMAVLKILKDYGSDKVKIASDNWSVTYSLDKMDLAESRVMAYSLDREPVKLDGNYFEFETSDVGFLEKIRKSINRFYHSGNEHFRCPDFENQFFGIKKLAPGQSGGVYICGQRFEFARDYDGLKDWVIFFKEKLPADAIDVSRDRVSLTSESLLQMGRYLSFRSSFLDFESKAKLFRALEPCWVFKDSGSQNPMDKFLEGILYCYDGKMKFPPDYLAYSNADEELVAELRRKGLKICYSEFAKFGMSTIKSFVTGMRAHQVVEPTEIQAKKIKVLKDSLRAFASSLQGKHFTADELNAKIYLFDNKAEKEARLYSDTLAEAIVEGGVSKGFWLDKGYLDSASFHDVLETALHELSHKVGGDGSSKFGYKLTDVNSCAFSQLINDPICRERLRALSRLWEELNNISVV